LLSAATLVALIVALALSVLGSGAGIWLGLIPFGVVGAIIARKQPFNPVGSVLLCLALTVVLCSDAGEYAMLRYRAGDDWLPLGRVAVFLAPGGWFWLVVLLPLPLALFPDARLTRRWRVLLWSYLLFAAVVVGNIIWEDVNGIGARHIQVDASGQLAKFSAATATSTGDAVTIVVYVAFFLAWIARLAIGYRRSGGDYRQQLKWLLAGGITGLVGVTLAISTGGSGTVATVLGGTGFVVGLFALPVSLGIGILKYRLYEIDRLISRTLSYLIVTGLLVGVFIGIVALATDVLPFSSPIAVAASTLAAAALFNPLRLRVQRLVDRRFNRARYDAEAIVSTFTMRLRDAVDIETVSAELLAAVDGAVQPAHVSVWIRPPR
jgi:hypothetical protein